MNQSYQLWDNFKQPKIKWNPENRESEQKNYLKKYWLHIFQIYEELLAHRSITPNPSSMRKTTRRIMIAQNQRLTEKLKSSQRKKAEDQK